MFSSMVAIAVSLAAAGLVSGSKRRSGDRGTIPEKFVKVTDTMRGRGEPIRYGSR